MPDSPAVVIQKAALRRVLLAARAARPEPDRAAAAVAVARVLAQRL
ncbi:MAG: 5-formyltetrahydrofolate cyclo-ligase, partial [Modestobacter sp.]|nr:5-formyltetrahydrofolate cyclo-ligase [Modestobacter sp.]